MHKKTKKRRFYGPAKDAGFGFKPPKVGDKVLFKFNPNGDIIFFRPGSPVIGGETLFEARVVDVKKVRVVFDD